LRSVLFHVVVGHCVKIAICLALRKIIKRDRDDWLRYDSRVGFRRWRSFPWRKDSNFDWVIRALAIVMRFSASIEDVVLVPAIDFVLDENFKS
jgi:hypothetical protein